jgi:hypothetical protein
MKHFRKILAALAVFSAQAMAVDGNATPKAPAREEIPYASLDEALKALHAKPGVTFKSEGGWTVAYDDEDIVSWLLTPVGHPAYPSIVKRHIVNSAAGAEMATAIRCFAAKPVCDKFFGAR